LGGQESVFPFNRFHGQDILLSPEMRSTGEVMGLTRFGHRLRKIQMAQAAPLPMSGRVFISVSDAHKKQVAGVAKLFTDLGFELNRHRWHGVSPGKGRAEVQRVFKLTEGRPNTVDLLKNRNPLVINTPPAKPARRRVENPHHRRLHRHPDHDHPQRRESGGFGDCRAKESGYG